MFGLFTRKPSLSAAARIMGKRAAAKRISAEKALKRAKCDEMRAAMGMPPVDWNAL